MKDKSVLALVTLLFSIALSAGLVQASHIPMHQVTLYGPLDEYPGILRVLAVEPGKGVVLRVSNESFRGVLYTGGSAGLLLQEPGTMAACLGDDSFTVFTRNGTLIEAAPEGARAWHISIRGHLPAAAGKAWLACRGENYLLALAYQDRTLLTWIDVEAGNAYTVRLGYRLSGFEAMDENVYMILEGEERALLAHTTLEPGEADYYSLPGGWRPVKPVPTPQHVYVAGDSEGEAILYDPSTGNALMVRYP